MKRPTQGSLSMRDLRGAGMMALSLLSGCGSSEEARILLMPVEGKMMVNALVPDLDGQIFGLGILETIGSAEAMWLVNHPEAEVQWQVDSGDGRTTTTWTKEGQIRYVLDLAPAADHVDLTMTITNRSTTAWHGVFAFNCVSPARAPALHDSALTRTYMSVDGHPRPLAEVPRTRGPRPGVTVYPTRTHEKLPPFAEAFQARSATKSNDSWVVVISESGDAHMATTAADAAFRFTNTSLGCLHAAPSFGTIDAGGQATVRSRVFFSKGGPGAFLDRYSAYQGEQAQPGG